MPVEIAKTLTTRAESGFVRARFRHSGARQRRSIQVFL
jgi:hypothetical protein